MENLPSLARASESWKAVVFGWPTRCAISSAGPPTTTDALSRLVSWSCSRPKPAMYGCSTALISSPQGSPEMAKLNRSRSWKPRPRLPSNGRAAIGSVGRRSSIRIRIPVASSPSSDTQPTNSPTSNNPINPDQAGNFKYVCLDIWPLFDEAMVAVVHRDHRLSRVNDAGIGHLAGEQLLVRSGCEMDTELTRLLEEHRVVPGTRHEIDTDDEFLALL